MLKKAIFFLLLAFVCNAPAALYKCNVNGKVEFSDRKCAENAVNLLEEAEIEQRKEDEAIGKGKWNVSESESQIDDSQNVILSLLAETSVRAGYKSATPSLFIRCAEKKLSVFINVGMYLGMDFTRVLVRFDNQRAETNEWSISTDYEAIFAPGKYRYMNYINTLMKYRSMLVKLTPYGESPIQFKFDLRGLRSVISPIKRYCN